MNERIFIQRKEEKMPKSAERCQEIRDEMRSRILHDSILYFARNGFAGTKISDLARQIGIGQGTIYVYFKSKEELFQEIFKIMDRESDIKRLKMLSAIPMPAKEKIHKLSNTLLEELKKDENFAAVVTLNTQMLLELNAEHASVNATYQTELYKYTAKIIEQGQKEGSVVEGSSTKLADYYWGVIYLYSLKRLFTTKYEMISVEDLERTLLKEVQ